MSGEAFCSFAFYIKNMIENTICLHLQVQGLHISNVENYLMEMIKTRVSKHMTATILS